MSWAIVSTCTKCVCLCQTRKYVSPNEGNTGSEESSAAVRSSLRSPPVSNHQAWKRRDEVLGMNTYIYELVAWANQASVEFGKEIAQAARWPTQIAWDALSRAHQARGVLFSVLQCVRELSFIHGQWLSSCLDNLRRFLCAVELRL